MSNLERRATGRTGFFDQLFVGGCTAAYVVLIGSVVAALRLYGV